jgi:hypothetical protein
LGLLGRREKQGQASAVKQGSREPTQEEKCQHLSPALKELLAASKELWPPDSGNYSQLICIKEIITGLGESLEKEGKRNRNITSYGEGRDRRGDLHQDSTTQWW